MERVSLYERLGKKRGIAGMVDDIVEAHMQNPVVKTRFLPYMSEPDRLKKIKEHTVQFFSAGTGGPDVYEGRSMPEAHRGMNISEAEYVAVIDDIMEVMERHDIDEDAQREVLAILYSLKDQIMHQ